MPAKWRAWLARSARRCGGILRRFILVEWISRPIRTPRRCRTRRSCARGAQKWSSIKEILGIDAIQRIAWTAGFDNKDWASEAVILAPAPRKGLLALMDSKPISAEAYASIPRGATTAGVGRLDLAQVVA